MHCSSSPIPGLKGDRTNWGCAHGQLLGGCVLTIKMTKHVVLSILP